MKYVSIDIETTGLDPERHQILSFGAIIEDTKEIKNFKEIPKFEFIFNDPIKEGASHYALAMNADILHRIANGEGDPSTAFPERFYNFLVKNGINNRDVNLAGKNIASFDIPFLENIDWRNGSFLDFSSYNFVTEIVGGNLHRKTFKYYRRMLDPAILYTKWDVDEYLPDLGECNYRAELSRTEVTHDALKDAWDVIQLLRKFY